MAFPGGAMGLNRDDQIFPQAQRGGLKQYPFSGIIDGCYVTAGAITPTAAPLTVSSGVVRLDGVECRLTADLQIPALIAGTGFDQDASRVFDIYINPVRKIKSGPNLPPAGIANEIFVQTIDKGSYEEKVSIKRWNPTTNAWVDFNMTYSPPVDQSHNNMLGTEVSPVNLALANFSLTPEKDIYLSHAYPPYVQAPSRAWLRRSASLQLARVTIRNSAATILRPPYSISAT